MSAPQIPSRSSSKRAAQRSSEDQSSDLEHQQRQIQADLKSSKKKLKAKGSFDSEYWLACTEVSRKQQQQTELQRKISLRDFESETGSGEKDWVKTQAARDLMEKLKGQELDEKLLKKQAERLQPGTLNKSRSKRTVFMKLFGSSPLGLGLTEIVAGRRDATIQSNFRASLVKESNSKHPDLDRPFMWCPIVAGWVKNSESKAAHIFAFKHGQDVMDEIFGPIDTPELFSPRNGILMCEDAEEKFDKGYIVIVPKAAPEPSHHDIARWHHEEPVRYEIRVLEPEGHNMSNYISLESNTRWSDLDGRELQFRSDFRPRARYLYFHYCVSILRRSWKVTNPDKNPLKDELGKPYWETPGRYVRRNMLLAFVEELGHEYESLLEGAIEEAGPNNKPEETALVAANAQVSLSLKKTADEGEESDDDEE